MLRCKMEGEAKLCHYGAHRTWGKQMFGSELSKLQWFVGLMGSSAVLVAFWIAFAVLHRRRLEKAAVLLAAIAGILTAVLYVSMWGFTISPL